DPGRHPGAARREEDVSRVSRDARLSAPRGNRPSGLPAVPRGPRRSHRADENLTSINADTPACPRIDGQMYLLTLGLNHQTAPLTLREKVSFPGDALRAAIADLRSRLSPVVAESGILSTCNRTEIYCATPESDDARHRITRWLGDGREVDPQPLQHHL